MKKYKRKFNIFKVIIGKDNPVIVEVGAHFGEDSMRFAHVFPNSIIHCFEPDPRCIKVFKKYVSNERIKLHELALSNKQGQMEFYQSFKESETIAPPKYDWISNEDYENLKLGNSGSSSLKKGYSNVIDGTIKVDVKRYDEWALENKVSSVDLAWIDVQGAEKDVLDGMGESINQVRHIWIEYGEKDYDDAMSRSETIDYLLSKGFELIEHFSSSGNTGDLLFRRVE